MVEGREVPVQSHVVCETAYGHVELRMYGGEHGAPSSWWIGIHDTDGMLRRTWIADGSGTSRVDLRCWLRPIVGYEIASRLETMTYGLQDGPKQGSARLVALR